MQDLTAVSLSVAAATRRLDGVADPRTVEELRLSAESARQSVGALRNLLVEVYPPNLAQEGLPAALRDLADATTARGMPTELDVSARLRGARRGRRAPVPRGAGGPAQRRRPLGREPRGRVRRAR